MKKSLAFLLAFLLVVALIPISATIPAKATSADDTYTLTSADFIIERINNLTLDSNNSFHTTSQYPQFRIAFNEVYVIKSITLTITTTNGSGNSGYNYRIDPNAMSYYYNGTATGATFGGYAAAYSFALNATTEHTYNTPSAYAAKPVDKIQMVGSFTSSESSNKTLTIDSIVITGVKLTDTVELTSSDIVLEYHNNCSIDGNTVYSTTNQYPQFFLNFSKNYCVRSLEITATASGINYTTGNNNIKLRYESTMVYDIPWYYLQYVKEVTSKKSVNIPEEYQYKVVNKIYFGGSWTSKPAANNAASLTIESVLIKAWIVPQNAKVIDGEDVTVAALANATVSGNNITTWNRSPQFRINIPAAEQNYAESVELTFTKEGGTSGVTISGGTIIVNFDDGTSANISPTSGTGWRTYIAASGTSVLHLDIPEAYRSKKTVRFTFVGWQGTNNADYNAVITLDSVTLNGVPDAYAKELIDSNKTPLEYEAILEDLSPGYVAVVSKYIYRVALHSFEIADAPLTYLDGKLTANVSVFTDAKTADGYYVSEVGIVAVPTADLAGTLTTDTEGAQTVSVTLESSDDSSPYKSFDVPFVGTAGYVGEEITARAFVKFSNGTKESVFYSENTVASVTNGIAAEDLPALDTIGDANTDSSIDIRDLVRIKKIVAEDPGAEGSFMGADTFADGELNNADLDYIKKFLIGTGSLATVPYAGEFTVTGTLGVA